MNLAKPTLIGATQQTRLFSNAYSSDEDSDLDLANKFERPSSDNNAKKKFDKTDSS